MSSFPGSSRTACIPTCLDLVLRVYRAAQERGNGVPNVRPPGLTMPCGGGRVLPRGSLWPGRLQGVSIVSLSNDRVGVVAAARIILPPANGCRGGNGCCSLSLPGYIAGTAHCIMLRPPTLERRGGGNHATRSPHCRRLTDGRYWAGKPRRGADA